MYIYVHTNVYIYSYLYIIYTYYTCKNTQQTWHADCVRAMTNERLNTDQILSTSTGLHTASDETRPELLACT